MYVAVKELILGNGKRAAPGQPVPEALTWDYPVIIAHLNLNWIKWVSEDGVPRWGKEETPINPFGLSTYEGKESPHSFKRGTKNVHTVDTVEKEKPTVNAVSPETITCSLCPGRTFTTTRNLKTHVTLAHGKRK
jgi:hypothetical protein